MDHQEHHEHHHVHEEGCTCGCHDHHEHRHDHGEDCTCGCQDHHDHHAHHGHSHSHGQEDIIRVSVHDVSVVGSTTLVLDLSYEEGTALVSSILSAISADVTAHGGIVGHIKALVTDMSRTCMLSVTDDEPASRTEHPVSRVQVECACIVMAMEPAELERIMFRHLSKYL